MSYDPNEPRDASGKWTAEVDAIIQKAEQTLHGEKPVHNPTIDTRGMSDIGKHTLGQVGQFNVSKETAAQSILKEGYSKFTSHISLLGTNHPQYPAASAAQDKISDAHERLFKKEL